MYCSGHSVPYLGWLAPIYLPEHIWKNYDIIWQYEIWNCPAFTAWEDRAEYKVHYGSIHVCLSLGWQHEKCNIGCFMLDLATPPLPRQSPPEKGIQDVRVDRRDHLGGGLEQDGKEHWLVIHRNLGQHSLLPCHSTSHGSHGTWDQLNPHLPVENL